MDPHPISTKDGWGAAASPLTSEPSDASFEGR
jgi:hypothetical protein